LKKKKKEEAKVEEDFCCCRASALFDYSFGRYFARGKAEMYAWLSTGASSPSFLSHVSVFVSFFMRPQSGILCAVEGGETTVVEEEKKGGGQG